MKRHNINLYRGDDISIALTVKGYDLQGVERIDLHAKNRGKVVLSLSTTDNSIEIIGERVLLHFAHHHTDKATYTDANYDLQVIKAGKIRTLMAGEIRLTHDITEV